MNSVIMPISNRLLPNAFNAPSSISVENILALSKRTASFAAFEPFLNLIGFELRDDVKDWNNYIKPSNNQITTVRECNNSLQSIYTENGYFTKTV